MFFLPVPLLTGSSPSIDFEGKAGIFYIYFLAGLLIATFSFLTVLSSQSMLVYPCQDLPLLPPYPVGKTTSSPPSCFPFFETALSLLCPYFTSWSVLFQSFIPIPTPLYLTPPFVSSLFQPFPFSCFGPASFSRAFCLGATSGPLLDNYQLSLPQTLTVPVFSYFIFKPLILGPLFGQLV